MRNEGYGDYVCLFLRPASAQSAARNWNACQPVPRPQPEPDTYTSTAIYKASIRKAIAQAGYRVIANVGDQIDDLATGGAEASFLLPNPWYGN